MQVSDIEARAWYLKEAAEQMWSYRTLDRNISMRGDMDLILFDSNILITGLSIFHI